MTLGEFGARQRPPVTSMAVSKAIARGRLGGSPDAPTGSVAWNDKGRPSIVDAELGDREWEDARRSPTRARPPAPQPAGWVLPPPPDALDRDFRPAPAISASPPTAAPPTRTAPTLATSVAIKEAANARKELARAEMAEGEAAKRRGQLINAEQARRDVTDAYTLVKTRVLGVPTRFAQRFPEYAAVVVPELAAWIREALEELAGPRR